MRELLEFLAVFAGIYLFDCVHWARRETVGFRAWWGRRARLVAGEDLVGNERYGIVFAQPLLPFGRVFLTQPFPLSLGADEAVSYVASATNPGPRPPQLERIVSLAAPVECAIEARRVFAGGKPFVDAGSVRLARRIGRLLPELARSTAKERAKRLDALVRASFDAEAIRERVSAFERAVPWLRAACTAELALVFAITPAVAFGFGLARTWIPLLTALVLLQALVTWLFVRAHRTLFPDEKRARRAEAIPIAFSPPSAMRACDALSRDLFAEFHPLAVAAVLLPREEFAAFAERVLRDALHALPAVREAGDERVRKVAEAWNARLLPALEACAERAGLGGRPWREPPPRLEADCLSYCPRCARQFTLRSGGCERCQGLPLAAFDPP